MKKCVICKSLLTVPIYKSAAQSSITSLCEIVPYETRVYYCDNCSHLQTDPIANIESYYSTDYKILIESEEEDQLYKIENGKKIFRFDFQAETLLSKVDIPNGGNLLDYGCAKASTVKKILQHRPDLKAYLFDVSDMYKSFWKKFLPEDRWSTFECKPSWDGHFDVVTSFYALEHVEDPVGMLQGIYKLLKPGGKFYCIVPNVFQNTADLIVADHVNHFSRNSLIFLFERAGFGDINLDDQVHNSAFVVTGCKKSGGNSPVKKAEKDDNVKNQVIAMSYFWTTLAGKIRGFESDHLHEKAAIYGSGFYGTFVYSCLAKPENISCFIDQSPFRQGKELFGRKVISPEGVNSAISNLYIGLNPRIAKGEIEAVTALTKQKLTYFYL